LQKQFPLNLTLPEQELIRQNGLHLVFLKDHTVFSAGDDPRYSYLIDKGRVKIYRLNMDGEYITVSIRHQGEIFGLAEVLCNNPRQCFAETLETTSLYAVDRENLNRILSEHPLLGIKIAQVLACRLRQAETVIYDLVSYNVPARLARLLLTLSRQCGRPLKDSIKLDIVLTHREIASMIGTTRQSVSQTLQEFKESNILEYKNKEFVIKDIDKLYQMAK
jgi:CRP-like cAMP-binding protein